MARRFVRRGSGRRRSTRRFSATVRHGRTSLSAAYSMGEEIQDGELTTSTLQFPNTGSTPITQGVLLYGVTDLSTVANTSNHLRRAKLVNLTADVRIFPIEGNAESGAIDVNMWFMSCPAIVFSDWIANNRNLYTSGLGGISAANPHRHWPNRPVSKRLIWSSTDVEVYPLVAKLRAPSFCAKYPDQVYLMFSIGTTQDDATAGIPTAAVGLTYNFSARVFRPNVTV